MRALMAGLLVAGLASCTVVDSNRAGVPFLTASGDERRAYYQGSYSLPRKYLSYKILANNRHFRSASHFAVTEAPTASVLVPDPNANFRYDVNYSPSRFSRDNVVFDMTDQMLSSVTVSTQDATGEVLVNLAQAAAQISRISAGLTTSPRGAFTFDAPGASSAADPIDKVVAQISFDPTDVASVARAKQRMGNTMQLRIQPEPRPVLQAPACTHSVCYRPLTTVVVSFEERHSGNSTDFVVQVPDPHQLAGIDLERSAFVDRKTILIFSGGTLQKVDLTKPSEVAAAALLPVRIIEAVFTGTGNAISGLLGLRQNELQGSVDLLNAQADYLEALAAYRATLGDAEAAGIDIAALDQSTTGRGSGPASFDTPGGQSGIRRDETDPEGPADAPRSGPGTFGGTPAPAGAASTPAGTDRQKFRMVCNADGSCVFEVADDADDN